MAILKHIPVKNRYYSSAVEYLTCQFDEYTNKPIFDEKGRIMEREEYLIEGVNCEVDTFGAECIETNRFYGKNNAVKDVKAHHYIISFDPTDNITMEEALAFGKEWLCVFAPGHQAVIAAHPDGHHGSKNMHAIKEKAVAEAKRIAEEKAREEARIEAERKAMSERAEQKKKEELSQKKRKLAFERNGIQFEYFMANSNSDDWNSDYAKYLMAEKITDFDAKSIEELSKPILTKEEFERKQIEEQQKEICKKAHELWNDTLNNIDGLVYPHKWEYLNYLEEIRYRKASTLTLQQVKEPILSFEEFNEMMERESARPVEAVGNVHDAVVVKDAEEIEETIGIEKNPTEDLEVQDISILESTVEEVAVMEPVIERPLTIGERAKEISTVIRNDYGRYDNVPVKVKAELFQFSVDDFEADMKLHSLVLKEINVRMYSSELYDDYMSIVDATDKKKLGELQKVDQYSKEKRWNQSR